ncbi:SURF1 family protein [Agrobacterium sp. a22-2]|uniref:SURF1 family protein n=1 Tax=Agrobacterium sp. a22-2 TaxID=2283840 RepID=UPI001FEE2346|nr:SURF1 family protein [Agrobacterium sp. a22-2]
MGRGKFLASLVIVLLALALLLALGTWQVQRLYWKEALVADIEERRAAAPAPLSEIEALAAAGTDIDYRHATATGRYLNDKERHFFATFQGMTGFYVYTPLELADGRTLFVNRGFVAYEDKAPEARAAGQLQGEQTVVGLARARLAEKPSFMVPENDPAKNIFYWKDLDQMAVTTGLPADRVLPFFLDADATPNPGGVPIGGVTLIDLPNSHLQYAMTWYGLAAVLAVVSAIALFRRKT